MLMQPQGCIFQIRFLGEVKFKKSFKKWTFQKKKWGSIWENPKKRDFSHYLGAQGGRKKILDE